MYLTDPTLYGATLPQREISQAPIVNPYFLQQLNWQRFPQMFGSFYPQAFQPQVMPQAFPQAFPQTFGYGMPYFQHGTNWSSIVPKNTACSVPFAGFQYPWYG